MMRLAPRTRNFRKDRRGATAVEFALIAPLLFFIILGTIETGSMFLRSALLDYAIGEAGRMVRTGQLADATEAEDLFQQRLCGSLMGLIHCPDIWYDVREFNDFADITFDLPFDSEGELLPAGAPDFGDSSSIIVVRAVFEFRFFSPLMGAAFGQGENNTRLLFASTVFRNEPFDVDWLG